MYVDRNDIGRIGDEILQSEHRELGRTLRVEISRFLPVHVSECMNRKIGQVP